MMSRRPHDLVPRRQSARATRLTAVISLVLFVSACAGIAPHAAYAQVEIAATPDRETFLAELAAVIHASINRSDTSHPVFHGCYDWHSAVHGHWAILRIARATGHHDALAEAVIEALESDDMAIEAEHLRSLPRFEMPYGRAWFLRLCIEYDAYCTEQNRAGSEQLTTLADEVAQSLLDFYADDVPSPASREYAIDSWALVQLHAFLTSRENFDGLAIVDGLIQSHFTDDRMAIRFSIDRERPDFFSVFGNRVYLIAHTQDSAALQAMLNERPITDAELRPVDPLLRGAHHLGINWSRAWALRALSRKVTDESQQQRFEAAFSQHVATGWKHHLEHAGDYATYDHWVPQFAVYALTE